MGIEENEGEASQCSGVGLWGKGRDIGVGEVTTG